MHHAGSVPPRTALITGTSRGLGAQAAVALAIDGWTVLRVTRRTGALDGRRNLPLTTTHFTADLSSLTDVALLAQHVLSIHKSIDLLVNNAAVGYGPPNEHRRLSPDGYELRLATNYLAPALLSELLLPGLQSDNGGRIVNIGSMNQGNFDLSDPNMELSYFGAAAYQRSKLALAALTLDYMANLQHRGVAALYVHPGTRMNTRMVTESGSRPLTTVAKGVDAVLQAATRALPKGEEDCVFDGTAVGRAHPQAYDRSFRRELRRITEAMIESAIGPLAKLETY